MNILYTAEAVVEGGRAGHGRTSDGRLTVELSVPKAMGGDGGPGTNPEQLFAVGYAALLSVHPLVCGARSYTRRLRLDHHRAGGDRSRRSRRLRLAGCARLARAAPVAGRGRRSDASSPRALPVLERHAGQRRRHARRRRSRVGPEGRVTPEGRKSG